MWQAQYVVQGTALPNRLKLPFCQIVILVEVLLAAIHITPEINQVGRSFKLA